MMGGFSGGLGFFDLLKKLQNTSPDERNESDIYEPYDPPPVEDTSGTMEMGDLEDFTPDETLTVRPSPQQNTMMGLEDWAGRMPKRQDYEPSLGRKILAGFAGFLGGIQNPAQGVALARDITGHKYNEALSDWEAEGKGLGNVGELGQKFAETERKGVANKMTFESAMEGVKQRQLAEEQRHADRMSAAQTDQEKAAEVARHDKALEADAKVKNAIQTRFAGAREKSAEAYAGRMDKLNTQNPRVKAADMDEAFWSSVEELITEMMPEAESYVIRDPKSQKVIGWKPDLNLSPNEPIRSNKPSVSKFQILKNQAMKRAKEKMQGLEMDEDVQPGDFPLDFELPGPPTRRRY